MLHGPIETAPKTRIADDSVSDPRRIALLRGVFGICALAAIACAAWGYFANRPLAFFGGLAGSLSVVAGWLKCETASVQPVGWMVWQRCAAAFLMLCVIESGYWLRARHAGLEAVSANQAATTLKPVSFSQAKGDPYAFAQWWTAYGAEWYRDARKILEPTPDKPSPYVFKPNTSRPFFRGTVSVNSFGLCDREVPYDKGNKFRIVCMGSSHTQCSPIEATDTSWPAKLEQLIHDQLGDGGQIEVLNAGATAFTAQQNLHRLKEVVLPLKPDLIVTYFGYNEFDQYQKDFKLPAGVPGPKPRPSKLLEKFDWRLAKWVAQARSKTEPLDDLAALAPRLETCRLALVYHDYMEIAHENGIPLVVCNFNMAVDEKSPEEVVLFYEQGFPKVRSMVQANRLNTAMLPLVVTPERGGRLIDVHQNLDGDWEENFLDLVHLTEAGKARLAENVFHGIRELLPQKPLTPDSPKAPARVADRPDGSSRLQ